MLRCRPTFPIQLPRMIGEIVCCEKPKGYQREDFARAAAVQERQLTRFRISRALPLQGAYAAAAEWKIRSQRCLWRHCGALAPGENLGWPDGPPRRRRCGAACAGAGVKPEVRIRRLTRAARAARLRGTPSLGCGAALFSADDPALPVSSATRRVSWAVSATNTNYNAISRPSSLRAEARRMIAHTYSPSTTPRTRRTMRAPSCGGDAIAVRRLRAEFPRQSRARGSRSAATQGNFNKAASPYQIPSACSWPIRSKSARAGPVSRRTRLLARCGSNRSWMSLGEAAGHRRISRIGAPRAQVRVRIAGATARE